MHYSQYGDDLFCFAYQILLTVVDYQLHELVIYVGLCTGIPSDIFEQNFVQYY